MPKLTPTQLAYVKSPKFKAWFGDWENDPKNASQVVDNDGFPLIVYHGTNELFNEFYDGCYTFFAKDRILSEGYGMYMKQCFLNIRRPLVEEGYCDVHYDIRPEWDELKRFEVVDEDNGEVIADGIEYYTDAEILASDTAIYRASTDDDGNDIEDFDIDDVEPYKINEYYDNENITTNDILKYADNWGCDGAIFKNIMDPMHDDGHMLTNVYAVLGNAQIQIIEHCLNSDYGQVA